MHVTIHIYACNHTYLCMYSMYVWKHTYIWIECKHTYLFMFSMYVLICLPLSMHMYTWYLYLPLSVRSSCIAEENTFSTSFSTCGLFMYSYISMIYMSPSLKVYVHMISISLHEFHIWRERHLTPSSSYGLCMYAYANLYRTLYLYNNLHLAEEAPYPPPLVCADYVCIH